MRLRSGRRQKADDRPEVPATASGLRRRTPWCPAAVQSLEAKPGAWSDTTVAAVLGGFAAIAAATLIPMMRGTTGEGPYVPPLAHGSFAAAVGGLALLAVALPARAVLRRWS